MPLGENPPVFEVDEADYPDELVFGFVYAVGTHIRPVEAHLQSELEQFGYSVKVIKLSDLLVGLAEHCTDVRLDDEPYENRVHSRMDLGNGLRKRFGRSDFAAMLAIADIYQTRVISPAPPNVSMPTPRTAYILSSLKREEEVSLLREVYGSGFYLISVYAPEQERLLYLQTQRAMDESAARRLVERDRDERKVDEGQRTSDTYALADVFIPQDPNLFRERLARFVDLVFGNPFQTPTQDENSMFLAYSASLRSGDLSRQVGAALTSARGDLLAVGCNDVLMGLLRWGGLEMGAASFSGTIC